MAKPMLSVSKYDFPEFILQNKEMHWRFPESKWATVVHEKANRATGLTVCSSKHFSWYYCSSTVCMAGLPSFYVLHSCQKLYLHILYHEWEPCLLQYRLLQFTPLHCLDQPTLFSFDLALTALADLFPDDGQSYSKNPPVTNWFNWLLAMPTSWVDNSLGSSSSLTQHPTLMLRHAST